MLSTEELESLMFKDICQRASPTIDFVIIVTGNGLGPL